MIGITRKDLFFIALRQKMYCSLGWGIHCFSMTQGKPKEPFSPYLENGKWLVQIPTEEEPRFISDAPGDKPVYAKRDPVSYKAGDFVGAATDGESNYTRILWHQIVVVFAFGDKIAFEPKGRTIGDIEKITSGMLVSNPKPGETVPDNKITVDQHLAYTEALSSILTGYAPIFSPSTTEKSLTTDPKMHAIRDKRLKENEARLSDPAVISSIKNELINIDREWLKGDDAADYLAVNKKSYDQVRVKTLTMHGEESAFSDGTQVTLIRTSLDEGLDLNHIPEYANSVRQASFNRGSETARGGELTQFLVRVFQNHSVAPVEDCGTKLFLHQTIPLNFANWFLGLCIFDQGKTITLTNENIGQYAGKKVALRSPIFCKAPGNSYCPKCIGEANAAHPEALGGQAADIGNTILYVFMKKAHGGQLKTNAFSIEDDLY